MDKHLEFRRPHVETSPPRKFRVGALFEAFQRFNPAFIVYGAIFSMVSFIFGIREAYITGVFYSLGIIITGIMLGDLVN